MSVRTPARADGLGRNDDAEPNRVRRLATETKASFKTTEFFAYIAVLVGILIAAGVVDQADAGGMGAKQAWLYVTILTVGYMVSRGIAKSGSRDPYQDDNRRPRKVDAARPAPTGAGRRVRARPPTEGQPGPVPG